MSNFIGNLLLTSVICSMVVLLTLVISPFLKKYTKKWRYIIFLTVAIKLLLPMPLYTSEHAIVIPLVKEDHETKNHISRDIEYKPQAEINVSIKPIAPAVINDDKVEYLENIEGLEENGQLLNDNSAHMDIIDNNDASTTNKSDSSTNKSDSTTNKSESMYSLFVESIDIEVIYKIIFGVWFTGVALCSCYYILMYFYHKRALNRWSINIADRELAEILKEEKEKLNIKRKVELKKCKRINTPMTVGILHLSIVLPYDNYDRESARYIVRHELSHQKRCDIYAKMLFVAAKCLHWFNPIITYMINKAYDDMEILCDDMVVADMHRGQRIEYNETILNIAKRKADAVKSKNILFAFCLVEKERNLTERMKNIMIMSKRKKGYQIVVLAMLIILASTSLISCGTKTKDYESDKANEGNSKVNSEVNSEVNKEVDAIYCEYINEILAPKYGTAVLDEMKMTLINSDTDSEPLNLEGSRSDLKTDLYKLNGIVSAYVDDMNADGTQDMIIVRYEMKLGPDNIPSDYDIVIDAYTIEDGKVKFLDEKLVKDSGYFNPEDEEYIEPTSLNISNQIRLFVNEITDGKNKYILLDSVQFSDKNADDVMEYHILYQLIKDKLEVTYAYGQNKPQSVAGDSLSYSSYVNNDEEGLTINKFELTDEKEKGLFDDRKKAIEDFFGKYGISVNLSENYNSIATEESLLNNIYSFEYYFADDDMTLIKKSNNYTNLSDW